MVATAQGGGGGGSRKPPPKKPEPPATLAPELVKVLDMLDRAQGFYIKCRRGLEALPYFDEDLEPLEDFGVPAELKTVGNFQVPVLPWGWHLDPVNC